MLIFTSAYVLLALASWSALAVPLSGSERYNENAKRNSLSSSILTGRQYGSLGPATTTIGGMQLDQGQGTQQPPPPPPGQGTQQPPPPPPGQGTPGPVPPYDFSTGDSLMDCDKSKSKSKSTGKGNHDNTDDNADQTPAIGMNLTPTLTSLGPPIIARRRSRSQARSPMKQNKHKKPSIFDRDNSDPSTPSPTSTANKPTTVGEIVGYKRTASRKRAMSPRTSRGAK